ncbi:MAG TPA: cytochrome d ubiquinol oxidase subunit II [bacterium]
MLINVIGIFLGVAILFYCLFGGADFGAAILECFLGKEKQASQKKVIAHALSPVWEANHVWLILAVVILFTGFPKAYSALSTIYYIPLTLMLVGVILRGCAFTFGNYDAIQDESQKYYSLIFRISGWLVPFTLGTIAGGTLLGRPGNGDFLSSYVFPWFNLFCFSVGLFTCVLFAFLASVYLVGETGDKKLQNLFGAKARTFNLAAVAAGTLVFASAQVDGFPLLSLFWSKPFSALCMGIASLILIPLWIALKARWNYRLRALAIGQVVLVLLGWFNLQFPVLLNLGNIQGEGPITLTSAAAPEITLRYLLIALLAGSLVVFPSLFYLLKVFKSQQLDRSSS